ncbi:hypothetical protein R6Y90_12835 [Alteromonas macleodii]|uniref:hypothetical protein n=1 Tax=Alteromonas macleodii TaxID=28108 RepID=UPI002981D06E|nr:hypothetical protein [Alteromonas macleodii]MDW5285845.1 hypothetical protein [Alteromonas macleodii]
MSSSAALVIFLFASLVLLYLVSQFSSVNFSKLKISDEPNIKNKDVSIAALFLLLISCVISICLSTYNFTDFSVDYDSMSVQLNFLIKDEIKFQMWNGRFFPLSHVDNAVILKIFKSFSALKVYLILHFIFLMTLAYFAFDFIPKNRRFVLLALIAISPPIVNIYSSAIYSERNILLFLVASTLFLRLGIKEVLNAKLALFFSVSLFFISLYFKETTILYLTSFLGLIFILKNFEALKAFDYKVISDYIKKPFAYVEVIFLLPCLLWFLSFFLLGGELNPEYVAKRDNSLTEYVGENLIELALISTIAVFMTVRARFDLYTVLILSCIPMVLYCLLVSQSMGAYNTFTYYNYLIYLAFSIYIVCTKTSKFVIIAPLTYIAFTLITISGFLEFTKEVNKRDKVVRHAVEIIKHETLNINLAEPWKERNLARFILYKAGQGNINHLTKHDLFCKDTNLYNVNTSCTIGEQPPSGRSLIDAKESSAQPEALKIINTKYTQRD